MNFWSNTLFCTHIHSVIERGRERKEDRKIEREENQVLFCFKNVSVFVSASAPRMFLLNLFFLSLNHFAASLMDISELFSGSNISVNRLCRVGFLKEVEMTKNREREREGWKDTEIERKLNKTCRHCFSCEKNFFLPQFDIFATTNFVLGFFSMRSNLICRVMEVLELVVY